MQLSVFMITIPKLLSAGLIVTVCRSLVRLAIALRCCLVNCWQLAGRLMVDCRRSVVLCRRCISQGGQHPSISVAVTQCVAVAETSYIGTRWLLSSDSQSCDVVFVLYSMLVCTLV